MGAGIILRHCGSYASKLGAGVDDGALALRVDIQNIYVQEPLSVGLGILRPGVGYDAALGLDVLLDAILDVIRECLAGVEPGKKRGACGWSGGDTGMNVHGGK